MKIKPISADRAVVLKNNTCPYCGVELGATDSTREHLVGRRFVPKGKLHQSWNLILRACKRCNNRKSELEDDLSALTMQPDVVGRYAQDDPDLRREAERKGSRSISRRTRKPIGNSAESLTLRGSPMPGLTMEVTLVGPPRAEPERVFELARLQLSGLFYWITFDRALRRGGFWLGGFFPLQFSSRGDWGNKLNRAFMTAAFAWHDRLLVGTTGGFFKAAIKRHPAAVCWSWALEWNRSLRVIGFFGEEGDVRSVAGELPSLEHQVLQGNEGILRLRTETALADTDDVLFSFARDAETTIAQA